MPIKKNKDITRIVNKVNKSRADFVNRLKDPNRLSIPDWEDSRYIATHKLGVGTDNNGQVFIYPSVQNINDKLVDFTNPKFGKWDGIDSAIERGDTVHVDNIQDGLDFTENYKRYYPKGKTFKYGGRRKAQLGLDIQYGGRAIPIGKNMVYFDGNKHEAGGIGVGNNLEVEGGEVGQRKGNSLRVFSSVPFLQGISPAQLVMGGANPDAVFKAQEKFKDRNKINDDGTRYENGGQRIIHINDLPSSFRGQYRRGNYVQIGMPPVANKAKIWNNTFKDHMNSLNVELKDFIIDGIKYGRNILPKPLKKYYSKFINILNSPGVEGVNNTAQKITQVQSMFDEKRAGGIYIKPSKRGTFTAAAKKRGMGVQEFASKVLANKEDYSSAMVKKANFARNASRWKKEYGGTMIFTINGNVKNGLSLRSKALFGTRKKFAAGGEDDERKEKKINADTKIGEDGLIYKRDAAGSWWTDGTKYEDSEYYMGRKSAQQRSREKIRAKQEPNILEEVSVVGKRPTRYAVANNGDVYDVSDYSGRISEVDGKPINIFDHPEEAVELLGYTPEIKTVGPGVYTIYNKHNNSTVYLDEVDKDKIIKTESIEGKKVNRPETKMIGNLLYEKNEEGRFVPAKYQPSKTIGLGVTRHGVSHPNSNTIINPLTGEIIGENNIVETEEPSVKGTTKINAVNSREESSPRRRGTQVVTSQISTKPKTTKTVQTVEQPAVMRREEYYSQPSVGENRNIVDESYNTRQSRGLEAISEYSPSSTGGGTKPKTNEIDEPLIGKFNPFTLTDAISGLGNMVGSTASYFINRNLIDKYPIPTKPIMRPAVKLKTRFDVSGDIADIEESRRIAVDAYKRNTQSSAAYLSRLQTGLNTAYRQKAEARRYGERMTNQLINADLQNRQNVYARNVAAQNDYYNRLLDSRRAKSQLEMQNLNNLISGLTGGVTSLMSNIDTRANYNKMAQAIQAASPNVDPRLLGLYDYYEGAKTKRKYKKRDVING